MTERLKWGLIVFLAIVWATNITAPLFIHTYKPPPEIHVAFMTVMGALVAHKPGNNGDGTQ